jgi:hypothetical protein
MFKDALTIKKEGKRVRSYSQYSVQNQSYYPDILMTKIKCLNDDSHYNAQQPICIFVSIKRVKISIKENYIYMKSGKMVEILRGVSVQLLFFQLFSQIQKPPLSEFKCRFFFLKQS